MEANDNKDLNDFLNEITTIGFFTTLAPDKRKSCLFNAKVSFERYSDMLGSIRDLLKICLHTLYNSGSQNSGQIKNPEKYLISILEVAVQLLPLTEGEALDEMHKYVLKFDKDNEADKKTE
ncbi:hypothetical protein [Flavobacterium bizetiae]|uniref:hypothetical protein n=1 Tax=Flavobacterium bizetiae TaxID=2704140 RepID=UPI003757613D